MQFYKYHGLGNDYIVIDPKDAGNGLSPGRVRAICHRNFGIGSDGILLGPFLETDGRFRVKIFNPDGSEAEKSGNGVRIFARYLMDTGRVADSTFTIATIGGDVCATALEDGRVFSVGMGRVSFHSTAIPLTGPGREVLNEYIVIKGASFLFSAATIGNPHCVIIRDAISESIARELGPDFEIHPFFPNKTNVQFVKIIDDKNIAMEIWERGAGYTLASGSSSCAAAAVVHRVGLCGPEITVHMPGGRLLVRIDKDFSATLTGPVTRICRGEIDPSIFKQ
ncbi:MAG: diaminopimelate epimerase [Deltaproteobacteria bacterium]|nr:diaminopimelate epimerase [Deltaproteobacteria bacterium]